MATPVIGARFSVLFMAGGVLANPLDLRFAKVSGLVQTVETTTVTEGGQNQYTQQLPQRLSHGNLVLERGFVVGSPLNVELVASFSSFRFITSNVLVTLLSEDSLPMAAWLFIKAWPVKWATSDLDAGQPAVLIDTLELAYGRMQVLRV